MDKQTKNNLLKIVKRNYDEIADDFSETRKKVLWPEIAKLAGMVKSGDKVLDAGCGNGRLLMAFVGKKINYLGVDGSVELIKIAKKNFACSEIDRRLLRRDYAPRNDNANYEFKNVDILTLDKLLEKNFDYVFCVAVLHHLPGKESRVRALEQMKNKLKPGGKIILTVWNLWGRKKFRRLILKFFLLKLVGKNKMDAGDILFSWKNGKGAETSERYYHAFAENGLKEIAASAGLEMEKIYKDEYNYYLILRKPVILV
ncbi:MAG: class I SAM-dependent methyltransferase [bacterium]